jgi:hypothetical protein
MTESQTPSPTSESGVTCAPEGFQAQRVWVVGSCGSGKTTVARRLGNALGSVSAHVDDYIWLPGWKLRDRDEMLDLVEQRLDCDHWVMEGNLGRNAQRLWSIADRSDFIVWLDLPFRVTFWRLVRRSFRRALFRQECCNGNRESFSHVFLSSNSILLYAFQTRRLRREMYSELLIDRPHVRLRTVAQVNGWLAAFEIESDTSPVGSAEQIC